MDRIAALLVHPDPEVRTALRQGLAEADFIRVLGEAVDAYEASELLRAIPYGLLFCGVDLPGEVGGFELAQALTAAKRQPGLVFIATDESRAFAAFELGAADYLLWPFSPQRIAQTLERLSRYKPAFREAPPPQWRPAAAPAALDDDPEGERTVQLPLEGEEEDRFLSALRQAWDTGSERPVDIEKLPITFDGRTILMPYTQILFIEAYEDYSFVHTATKKLLTSYRLKNLEERLRPHRFFRVHRKYLVNLDQVTEIATLPGGNFMLRTAGKTRIELPIGRRRIGELKQILGL
ncbi:two component transcriptional regulator, LytTR family [Solidesulfovibrio fructosivorans JJ]]|uniref:Two component transcriptional regulator, LytTR family n=1 Tax=Solidesulfovibrio fructosivorans JJ] TaxID=596151 RepID=E1K0H1_SOLFR|nr:LytTR family DNA-binding domain-containing protein [Solidesulfovibrio fructosivorans]EFL49914.1 two component transcriptional regulator, LytTR family [Solidesulfovibrio fructosivorans JJ]]